jgi:hypothetical protein
MQQPVTDSHQATPMSTLHTATEHQARASSARRGRVTGAVLAYLRAHWRGEHGLARSFWINFAAIAGLALALGPVLRAPVADHAWAALAVSVAQFVLFWLLIYPWQFMGVLRCCERSVREYSHGVLARLAPLAVLLGLGAMPPQAVGIGHALYVLTHEAPPNPLERPREYTISVLPGGSVARVSGFLDFGLTRDMRALLDANPQITRIVLDSGGGPVYEGRGVGKLFRERGIDTVSLTDCNSACTTAFIGGRERWLGPGARLGFHRYRMDAVNLHPFMDVEAEQRTDLAFYASRDIAPAFLARVFDAPHGALWYPSVEELRAAGVVHGVLPVRAAEVLAAH